MNDIVERLRRIAFTAFENEEEDASAVLAAADKIERLRAVIVRAKDALLDGQSTQWVHDLLVGALHD